MSSTDHPLVTSNGTPAGSFTLASHIDNLRCRDPVDTDPARRSPRVGRIHGKPVFFRQMRIGHGEAEFRVFKFRSMTDEGDADG
jgi:hypothetical protein